MKRDQLPQKTGAARPKVFLSYSAQDAVLARLIAQLFRKERIECFFAERDLRPGAMFDTKIAEAIRHSKLLIVIWSSRSASSPWVNQEVGIALGCGVPVWPIAIEGIEIEGAIFRNQGSYLSGAAEPHIELAKLARQIRTYRPESDGSFRPSIDQYILGKVARTQRIVELLREQAATMASTHTLRIQSAFSIFAVSADPSYRVARYHSREYHRLLVQELEGVKRLLAKGVQMKAILWPERSYEDKFLEVRFRNLVTFLEEEYDMSRVQFVLGRYEGGNLYIFENNVLVEGIKTVDSRIPGYEWTTVTYHGPTIDSAVQRFDERFNQLWKAHAGTARGPKSAGAVRRDVIQELRRMGGL